MKKTNRKKKMSIQNQYSRRCHLSHNPKTMIPSKNQTLLPLKKQQRW